MTRVGTAGWTVRPRQQDEGSHLFQYSRKLSCAEINSTFYRPHREATWARWAAETPPDFRFSVKAPRTITHEAKLRASGPMFESFLAQLTPLGQKAGPILFQLPPSLAFDPGVAAEFMACVRSLYQGPAALEPRHASWFEPAANELLVENAIARVAADPATGSPLAANPGGNPALVYYRLHGSPRKYFSSYDDEFLANLAAQINPAAETWVIFDNTAHSHAFPNAIELQRLLRETKSPQRRPSKKRRPQ